MLQKFKSPISVQIEITSKCNSRCVHCYNYWREDNILDTSLSKDDVDKILCELIKNDILDILITGGEPMLNKPAMFRLIEGAFNANIPCSINTNLTLLTDDIASFFKEYKTRVMTSIISYNPNTHDTISRNKGSFEKIVNNIKLLNSYQVPVSVNMVVMKQNRNEVYETAKFLYNELNITNFSATKVEPSQNCKDFSCMELTSKDIINFFDDLLRVRNDFKINVDSLTAYPLCLFKDLKKYNIVRGRGCNAGQLGCTIGSNGDVRACGHSDESHGNILKEPITEIWNRFIKWRDGSFLPDKCKQCEYTKICSKGCRMTCKFYAGINSEDPYIEKEKFELIFEESEKHLLLDLEEPLFVNPSVKFRKEDFGYIISTTKFRYPIVTEDTIKLLNDLKGKKFTLNEIIERYDINIEDLQNFFSSLVESNIVIQTN